MNLPEYLAAIRTTIRVHQEEIEQASSKMYERLAELNSEFFEEADDKEARR